jgi:hypothetical protein
MPKMRRTLKVIRYGAGLYLVFLVLASGFSALSTNNKSLASLERRLNPAQFVFWQRGEFFRNPPLFKSVMSDPKGQLSQDGPKDAPDVDIWVVLLEGPKDIANFAMASQLGLKPQKIAQLEPGESVYSQSVALHGRLHPIPFFLVRKSVLVMDAKYLRETYKTECLDEIVYRAMIDQRDKELDNHCELS